ncbi:hypothetical protein ANCCAN_29494 [Ancylostoma caninum]|uniref:Uncharacterized protein n=1 Tax=Ancylostoma caninum TaxID=29170 RepID=A0A368EYF4_ANCCA|nr:hypothetical protein ANCCAN_29494 [Ancylostoma caninum]
MMLSCALADQHPCSYSHSAGYSLRWLVLGENIVFHLDFPDFPRNSYTGVSFETENHGDSEAIIVQVNDSGIDVVSDTLDFIESTKLERFHGFLAAHCYFPE